MTVTASRGLGDWITNLACGSCCQFGRLCVLNEEKASLLKAHSSQDTPIAILADAGAALKNEYAERQGSPLIARQLFSPKQPILDTMVAISAIYFGLLRDLKW